MNFWHSRRRSTNYKKKKQSYDNEISVINLIVFFLLKGNIIFSMRDSTSFIWEIRTCNQVSLLVLCWSYNSNLALCGSLLKVRIIVVTSCIALWCYAVVGLSRVCARTHLRERNTLCTYALCFCTSIVLLASAVKSISNISPRISSSMTLSVPPKLRSHSQKSRHILFVMFLALISRVASGS